MSINADTCGANNAASIQCSQRLKTLAAFVPFGSERLIDVGCDHATVPLDLFVRGVIKKALLIDINAEPLKRARARAEKTYPQSTDRIQYLQTDGLRGVDIRPTDVLLISGLGGETMAEILIRAFTDCDNKRPSRMILQPQTKQYDLRATLQKLSLNVNEEVIIFDKSRYYTIIICDKTNNEARQLSELELYIGPKLISAVEGSLRKKQLSEADELLLDWAQAQFTCLELEGRGDASRARLAQEWAQLLEGETDD